MKIANNHRLTDDAGKPLPFTASPNCGGPLKPRVLVLHYTAGRSSKSACAWLCSPKAKAAAHLVIGKDGDVTQLVPFNVKAWHAGPSALELGGKRLVGLNAYSIGIELDNPGRLVRRGGKWRSLSLGIELADNAVLEAVHKHESAAAGWALYPAAQLEAAFEVASTLVERYRLEDVVGHEDIAPLRKSDPGPAFPMDSFRTRLLGRGADGDLDRYVTAEPANLRAGAGTQHAPVVAKPLPKGTKLQLLASDGSWRKVDVLDSIDGNNDLQGWIHVRLLKSA
jgi:N-acetylmuramoyl-L-alanine amidase